MRRISFMQAERNRDARTAEPDEVVPPFLETEQGRYWLRDAAEAVVSGRDYTWKRWMHDQRGLTADALYIELTQRCGQGPCTAEDVIQADLSGDERHEGLRADYRAWAISVAMELLAPLADDYAEYLKEQEEMEHEA